MRLSEHFTLKEAMKSSTALRHGIDNTPPDDLIPALKATAVNILEPVREEFAYPISPSSWYRCPELNLVITRNAASQSQHMKGEAVDFELAGVDNWDVADWIYYNLEFDQLIYEFMEKGDPTAGWIHCSFVEHRENRGSVLQAIAGEGYVPYSP